MPDVPPFAAGTHWSDWRNQLNTLVESVNNLNRLIGDGYITVHDTGMGKHSLSLNLQALGEVMPKPYRPHWFVATANATTSTDVNGCYVTANPCVDRKGNDTDTDTTVRIWLPRQNEDAGEPYVKTDDVLQAVHDTFRDEDIPADQWVAINANLWLGTSVTPYDMTAALTVETASALTWDVFNQPVGKDGVKLRVARTNWSTTDKKLYGYYRDYTFSSTGRLVAVTAETKVTLDTAAAC